VARRTSPSAASAPARRRPPARRGGRHRTKGRSHCAGTGTTRACPQRIRRRRAQVAFVRAAGCRWVAWSWLGGLRVVRRALRAASGPLGRSVAAWSGPRSAPRSLREHLAKTLRGCQGRRRTGP
jgi:hypothetical protein